MKTKKMFSKVFALLLAVVTVLAMSVTVFAAGNNTITVHNTIDGTTYKAYKIFDVTKTNGSTATYILSSDTTTLDFIANNTSGTYVSKIPGLTLTKSADGSQYNVTLTEAGAKKLAEELQDKKWSDTNLQGVAANGTATISGLDDGYYLIVATKNNEKQAVCMMVTASGDINEKNDQKPSPKDDKLKTVDVKSKNEKGEEITTKETTVKTYKIGDTVPFEINLNTVNIYNDSAASADQEIVKKYTLTDTPDNGLDIDLSTVVVKVTESTGTKTLTKGTDYTVGTAKSPLTVEVKWANGDGSENNPYTSIYENGALLTIKYSAKLTAIDGNGKAENHATIKANEHDGNNGKVTVQTYDFTLVKTNEKDEILTGSENGSKAKFNLKDASGNVIKVSKVSGSENTYIVDPTNGIEIIEAGAVKIKGLGEGTYSLVETEAPKGYNKLDHEESVTVGEASSGKEIPTGTTFTKANDDGIVEIVNNTGKQLPSTGGIGTTVFYVVGTILVAGAAIALIVRKRMTTYKD